MTTPEPPISPQGVPQLRTDWLADVARRLASVGFATLRALDADAHGHLSDVVDGRPWRFELMKFSAPHDTVVEFDAELWAPDDAGGRPTLRAGFALAPRWQDGTGVVALVRTEIGPRGAVTFDPENWMVTVPLATAAAQTSPEGVEPGAWTFDGGLPEADEPPPAGTPPTDDDLAGLAALAGTRLALGSLGPVLAGDDVPELLLPAFPAPGPAKSRGLLGRFRGVREPDPPSAVITLAADGPIEAAWTGTGPVEEVVETGLVVGDAAPVLAGEAFTVRGAQGVLTLGGLGLRVTLS